MKVRHALLALIIGFSSVSSYAEYYVVNTPYDIYATPRHLQYHHKRYRYHHVRRHYVDMWKLKHRNCYDPDLTTGDDDPCVYPDMDIDE
jgi:hypothetical protein